MTVKELLDVCDFCNSVLVYYKSNDGKIIVVYDPLDTKLMTLTDSIAQSIVKRFTDTTLYIQTLGIEIERGKE